MAVRSRRSFIMTFALLIIFYFIIPRFGSLYDDLQHPRQLTLLEPSPTTTGSQKQPKPHTAPQYDEEAEIPRGMSVFQPDGLSKHLVMPHMPGEDITWVSQVPEWLNMSVMVYEPEGEGDGAGLKVPLNKGHEAMAYLTYIINNYFKLPDVVVFVHSHAAAWHDNDLQFATMPLMLRELNYARVMKRGFMNLRCHWKPGCPAWIQPHRAEYDHDKSEEHFFAQAFQEMYGTGVKSIEVPETFGAICCAQFGVSAEVIRGNTLNEYLKWRQWLIGTPLPDHLSGRVMEYIWHYMFSPRDQRTPVVCPKEHICYCDGYGLCFGSEEKFKEHMEVREYADMKEKSLSLAEDGYGWQPDEDKKFREEGMERLRNEICEKKMRIRNETDAARQRGAEAEARKLEVGPLEFSG